LPGQSRTTFMRLRRRLGLRPGFTVCVSGSRGGLWVSAMVWGATTRTGSAATVSGGGRSLKLKRRICGQCFPRPVHRSKPTSTRRCIRTVRSLQRALLFFGFLPLESASKRKGDTTCSFNVAHRSVLNFDRTAVLPGMLVKLFEHAEVLAHLR
jgi:hypothetical protein